MTTIERYEDPRIGKTLELADEIAMQIDATLLSGAELLHLPTRVLLAIQKREHMKLQEEKKGM
jgi:hypothetical protein